MAGNDFEVTAARDWKKRSGAVSEPYPLKVPSGNVALVRPVGVRAFFELGMIPNSLLNVVQSILEKASKGKKPSDAQIEKAMSGVAQDPQQIVDLLKMADAITVYCVIEPAVFPEPEAGVERDEGLLYVDEVDLDDKLFIMNFAFGGNREVEPFREKLASNVGSISTGSDVERSTERPPRD